MRKSKGRGMPLEVEKRFRTLESGGYSAAQIYNELTKEFGEAGVGVSDRTIRTYVKACRPPDPSGTWTLVDDSEEPAFLLAVLKATVVRTEGRVFGLTRKEAEWVERIKHAVPDIAPERAHAFARVYMNRESEGEDTAHLDMGLAFTTTVGESPELAKDYIARHIELHISLWPDRPLSVWAREDWVIDQYEEAAVSRGMVPIRDVAPMRQGEFLIVRF